MRILFAAPYVPSEIRVRPYNFIKGLAQIGHSLTFIGLAGTYVNAETIERLAKWCENIEVFRTVKVTSYFHCFIKLPTTMPLQAAYSFSPQMKKRVEQLCSNDSFDVIHVEHIRAGYMLPTIRTIPAVYDSVDCITALYQKFRNEQSSWLRKFIATIESKKLAKSEPHLLSRYDAVIATTSRDKDSLETLSRLNNYKVPSISVIANGVDTDYFEPKRISPESYSVVFTGKMEYYANELAAIHLANEIFPKVKSRIPSARLYIVGAKPSRRIQQLQQNDYVVVTGRVPDIRQYLSLAHVVACPIRIAVGIQNKLLEAMSMAKAIVTYSEPTQVLHFNNSDIFLVANDTQSFADGIIKVMIDDSLRFILEKNARAYVEKLLTWHANVKKLENIYLRTIETYKYDSTKTRN